MRNPIRRFNEAVAGLTEAERIQLLGFLGIFGIVTGILGGLLFGYLIWGQ